MFLPESDKTCMMIWNLNIGFLPLCYTYDEYFKNVIKSPERALVRKAVKNGYSCREFKYDELLDDIHRINISKDSRQGSLMTSDYSEKLKPRQSIVGQLGQEIHCYGCFDDDGYIVAYYMFEHFGENIFHTVKGIGHADHLKFGIMNYLFAYSISCLYQLYPKGYQTLLYGTIDYGGGLSRFKRNVGCKFGCPFIQAPHKFFYDLKSFRRKYKIHDDTGLNFVLENFA